MPGLQLVLVAICLMLGLFSASQTIAQTKKRVIVFPDWSASNDEKDVVLDVVEVRVDGKKIAFNTPFEAGDDWLKTMTVQVKNVSGRPLSMIEIDAGLLTGIDEEPRLDELLEDRIKWLWESDSDKPVAKSMWLHPETAILFEYGPHGDGDSKVVTKKGNPSFCQLNFAAIRVRYWDGKEDNHPKVRFSLSGSF